MSFTLLLTAPITPTYTHSHAEMIDVAYYSPLCFLSPGNPHSETDSVMSFLATATDVDWTQCSSCKTRDSSHIDYEPLMINKNLVIEKKKLVVATITIASQDGAYTRALDSE